jgi:cytochrome c553
VLVIDPLEPMLRTSLLLVMLALACRCPRQRVYAQGHFEAAGPLRHAVITGDIESAEILATRLDGGVTAARVGAAGADAEARLHAAAGFLVAARDIEEAGEGLAAVAASCGACHQAESVELSLPDQPPEHQLGLGHVRIADALWWSLVAGEPSAAAPALATLRGGMIVAEPPERAVLAGQVQRAAMGGEPEEALAALLGRCAGCHVQH